MVLTCFLSEKRIWKLSNIQMYKTFSGKLVAVNKSFLLQIKDPAENSTFFEEMIDKVQYFTFTNYRYDQLENLLDKIWIFDNFFGLESELFFQILLSNNLLHKSEDNFINSFLQKNYSGKTVKKRREIFLLIYDHYRKKFEELDSLLITDGSKLNKYDIVDLYCNYLTDLEDLCKLSDEHEIAFKVNSLLLKYNLYKSKFSKRNNVVNQFNQKKEDNSDEFKKSFDQMVEQKKTLVTKSGIKVQSLGEKLIADYLYDNEIDFDYDEQITLKGNSINDYGYDTSWCRPDFYLNEFDLIIEYWGMNGDLDYDQNMSKKKRLYKEANKRFLGVSSSNLNNLDSFFNKKLSMLGIIIKNDDSIVNKKLYCKTCGRIIKKKGNGNCFACNKKAKKNREKASF